MVETALTPDFRIIDISQPIAEKNACFPGDTPFSRQVTVTYEQSKVINLTSLTMSPHVGTHIDAPVHVRGTMSDMKEMVGVLPLSPFIGECLVLDIAPWKEAIRPEQIEDKVKGRALPPRILFRTCHHIRYDVFEEEYAYFSVELVDYLAEKGVVLFGIDAPSADHIRAKELKAHHRLLKRDMYWLENLDLTNASEGNYFLVALPLKFMELEASPIRAVLLEGRK